MAQEKAPAFQFYPKDFLMDGNVSGMSLQERGAYITLLCICWLEGSLPADVGRLANITGTPRKAFGKFWPAIAVCFKQQGDRLLHGRLEIEREKQAEYRRRQSDKGKLGGRPTKAEPNPELSETKSPPLAESKPDKSSPVFVSDLQSPKEQTYVRSSVALNGTLDPTLADRAAAFCELYQELYPKHRRGARYHPKPAHDFPTAVALCGTWDDARLAQLAAVFLQTDHEFAANGSRTIGQFAALASWCDDRLREVEAGV